MGKKIMYYKFHISGENQCKNRWFVLLFLMFQQKLENNKLGEELSGKLHVLPCLLYCFVEPVSQLVEYNGNCLSQEFSLPPPPPPRIVLTLFLNIHIFLAFTE